MIGDLSSKAKELSSYQPNQDVIDVTKMARDDYAIGEEILNKSWPELNFRSVLDDEERGQMMFNAFVDETVEDPNEAWKWRGTRSMARNKGIAMHANLTEAMLIPIYAAQNENDEIDREFSDYMRSIVTWMTYPENSDYMSSYLNATIGMMDSPVTYMLAEYCEVDMEAWQLGDNDEYELTTVPDEVLSGPKFPVYRSNQVLINNAYERNIQRQKALVKRRYVEMDELEAKFGEHENWELLKPLAKTV